MQARDWNRETAKEVTQGKRAQPARKWSQVLIGEILQELNDEGLYISRPTILRLERQGLFRMRRTLGNWRVATRGEAEAIKKLIWINYVGMGREDYLKMEEEEKKEREKEK